MVGIIPMASSIRPSLSTLRFAGASRLGLSLASFTPRRLACFHLASAVPQSQSFGLKASKLLRGDGKTIGVAAGGNAAQASTTATPENVLEWVKQDKRRLLHVVYRVGDLDRTIKFYTECLGMNFFEAKAKKILDVIVCCYNHKFLYTNPKAEIYILSSRPHHKLLQLPLPPPMFSRSTPPSLCFPISLCFSFLTFIFFFFYMTFFFLYIYMIHQEQLGSSTSRTTQQ